MKSFYILGRMKKLKKLNISLVVTLRFILSKSHFSLIPQEPVLINLLYFVSLKSFYSLHIYETLTLTCLP